MQAWPVRASAQRLRSYAFRGGTAQIGLAVHDGQLSVAVDKVIDELVALLRRVRQDAPQNAERERQNRNR